MPPWPQRETATGYTVQMYKLYAINVRRYEAYWLNRQLTHVRLFVVENSVSRSEEQEQYASNDRQTTFALLNLQMPSQANNGNKQRKCAENYSRKTQ